MNYNRRQAERYADAAKLTGRDFDLDVEAQMAIQRSDDDAHWAAQQVVECGRHNRHGAEPCAKCRHFLS